MTSIEIAANPDHVHIFFHSISTQNSLGILKKLKGKSGKFYGGIYPISKNGAANISGRQAVSMGLWEMDGML